MMPVGSCKILESGNPAYMFLNQFFECNISISCFKRIKAQERGEQQTGTKYDPCFLWKGDSTGKMAMFGIFFRIVPGKNQWHHSNTVARPIQHKSYRFKTRVFSKNYRVKFWLLQIYFHCQKWTGINYYNLSNHHINTSVVPWEL